VVVTVVAEPDPVIVEVIVVTPPPGNVLVIVVTEPGRVVVTDAVVVAVTVVADTIVVGRLLKVSATMFPGVVPGQVTTASALHVPTGMMMYSCPLAADPILAATSIGAPM
jgi:hypothetical protein